MYKSLDLRQTKEKQDHRGRSEGGDPTNSPAESPILLAGRNVFNN